MNRGRRYRQSQPELPGRVLAVLPTGDPAFQRGEAPVDVGHVPATPSWRGERLDLDYAMSVLWRPRREPPAE